MATESSLPVGSSGEELETTKREDDNRHREVVSIADAIVDAARARVSTTIPVWGEDYGLNCYVSGEVNVLNDITGPLTDEQLRLNPVIVDINSTPGLTDEQFRASPTIVRQYVNPIYGTESWIVEQPPGGLFHIDGVLLEVSGRVRRDALAVFIENAFLDVTATLEGEVHEILPTLPVGRFHIIFGVVITCGETANDVFFSSGGVQISSTKKLAANGSLVIPFNSHGWFQGSGDGNIEINLALAGFIGVDLIHGLME